MSNVELKVQTLHTRLTLCMLQWDRARKAPDAPEWPFTESERDRGVDHLERKMHEFAVELRDLGEEISPVPGEENFK